jgi:hypothetical protein
MPELLDRSIAPWTPYPWAPDFDCDLAVVSQAAAFRLNARRSNNIKVFIELILNHLLHFITSQDSLPLRSISMLICD